MNLADIPLTEKYRPSKLSDIIFQSDIIKIMNNNSNNYNMPHLLFHGPPGTGKTSTILAICKQLYGDDYHKKILELNASDDRGITIIRGKIKNFSKMSVNKNGPPFKIIILDEADFLTGDAQSALRRCIESNSYVTRFCIICNYINKIIHSIKSRCAILYFKPIPKNIIKQYLTTIIEKEKITISNHYFETIVNCSNGDLRKTINSLEILSKCNKNIDRILIDTRIETKQIETINKYIKSNNFKLLSKQLYEILNTGICSKVIIKNYIDYILNNKKIDDLSKSKIICEISNIECYIIEGANDYIQLLTFFINIRDFI